MTIDEKLQQVLKGFRIDDTYLGCELIQVGNVNKTYRVRVALAEGKTKSFLIQNVNTYVFKNPIQVMENIDKVTEHIRKKQRTGTALHFHHTHDRKTYIVDGDNFWRLTNYIPSITYNTVNDMQIMRNAGRAFGEFQMQLADFNSEELYETIPDFHNTRKRYENLRAAVKEDACGLVASVQQELDYLFSIEDMACKLTDLHNQGVLPKRVTHNDTKINNVLFDENDGCSSLVVIDLDTVMPGLVGHDFGDAIRFASNYVEEDSADYERAGVNMEIFRAFTEGFLEKTAGTLSKAEIDTLALSSFALTVELAVRFLEDYIKGSPYFKVNYTEHNLVRTRCQIALAKDMQKNMAAMEQCVQECAAAVK